MCSRSLACLWTASPQIVPWEFLPSCACREWNRKIAKTMFTATVLRCQHARVTERCGELSLLLLLSCACREWKRNVAKTMLAATQRGVSLWISLKGRCFVHHLWSRSKVGVWIDDPEIIALVILRPRLLQTTFGLQWLPRASSAKPLETWGINPWNRNGRSFRRLQ